MTEQFHFWQFNLPLLFFPMDKSKRRASAEPSAPCTKCVKKTWHPPPETIKRKSNISRVVMSHNLIYITKKKSYTQNRPDNYHESNIIKLDARARGGVHSYDGKREWRTECQCCPVKSLSASEKCMQWPVKLLDVYQSVSDAVALDGLFSL